MQDAYIKKIQHCGAGLRIFLVGGTVRDILLGLNPTDYDFAVSGSGVSFARRIAQKLKGAFVLLSSKDDEARVVVNGVIFDFIGIGDGYIEDDLLRRDFTINAMAIDLKTHKFFDPCKGFKDLKRGILRVPGPRNLIDDPLRVLRGFRFSVELGFRLDKTFYKQVPEVNLSDVAPERIGFEIVKIMSAAKTFDTILKMNQLGIFRKLFPEARKLIDDFELWDHSLNTYQAIEFLMSGGFFTELKPQFSEYFSKPRKKALVKLAGLFHDVAKPDTFLLKDGEIHFYGHDSIGARVVEEMLNRRLRLSRDDIATVKRLVKEHMRLHLLATAPELTDRAIRRFFRDLGEDWLGAMMIAWADGYATGGRIKHLKEAFTRMIELKKADEAKPKIKPLVNGYDLIDLGMTPGPKFKIILQELFDLQLEGKLESKEQALKIAIKLNEEISKET